MSVEPPAKKYPGWSPYNYAGDNPINHIDPDGRKYKWYGSAQQIAELKDWVAQIGSTPKGRNVVKTLANAPQTIGIRFGNTKNSREHGVTANSFSILRRGGKNVIKFAGSMITLYRNQKGFNKIGTTSHELEHAFQGLTETGLSYKDGIIESKPISYSKYYNLPVEKEARKFSRDVLNELKRMKSK